jgi:hypothetical protein
MKDPHKYESAAQLLAALVFAWLVLAAMLLIYLLHRISKVRMLLAHTLAIPSGRWVKDLR